jgi:hypothetical protein
MILEIVKSLGYLISKQLKLFITEDKLPFAYSWVQFNYHIKMKPSIIFNTVKFNNKFHSS